jgi:hypothetical protein
MKPTYAVQAWREQQWWLGRIVGACGPAPDTPIDGLAHARSLVKLEQAARDLVATILDADEDSFDLEIEYVLPAQVETAVCEALGARSWLDAAQELWEDQCALAVHTLMRHEFTPAEAAKLLGIRTPDVDIFLDLGLDRP